MIVRIENGIVTIAPYGFSPGTYPIEEFMADDLQTERRILLAYRLAHPGASIALLDGQIARAIDDKCRENKP